MVDSFFNIIIVLIPIAIFIGRIVSQAQAKRKPAPPKRQPPIPVHFEDYDDEERRFAPSAVTKPAMNNKDKTDAYMPLPVNSAPIPPPLKKAKTSYAEPAQGFLNLNHLSAMKQAVIMAEILGPPKALQ